jgi:pilus assembly protein FimV
LDMPTFDAPKFMPESLADADETENVLDLSSLNASEQSLGDMKDLESFDDVNTESFEFLPTAVPDAEILLDLSGLNTEQKDDSSSVEFGADSDFNFNVETISPEAANYVDDETPELNSFDLNTINLELNDDANNAVTADTIKESVTELSIAGDEPIEVETKLDLVAAYIEMDDKEGAKELLEEVMKEGGAGQRKRAEALLAQIA